MMPFINVLMSLGLVALGLMLVIAGLQFGVIILVGIVAAVCSLGGWIVSLFTGKN